jgi:hypothetical protein
MHKYLDAADVAIEQAELLPEREALGFIDIANITGVNVALAINAGVLGGLPSTAVATAMQGFGVVQS